MTADLIFSSQSGDKEATLLLVEKFNPLLKKYSFKLFYEDSYNDLLADFLDLIHSIELDSIRSGDEGSMVAYIKASMHNSYVKRLRKIHRTSNVQLFSELSDSELYYMEVINSTEDKYKEFDAEIIGRVLSNSETAVIRRIYFLGYTSADISKIIGVSRQAVNQMKNRALKKLKNFYSDKP